MSRTKIIISILCAAFLFRADAALMAAPGKVSAVATYTKGKVQVLTLGSKSWNDLRMGQFIYEGDTVRTGPGARAGITYTGGIENRLNANTTFKVEPQDVSNAGAGNRIRMMFGKVWTKILVKGTKFQIHTPVAVCSVRGTEFETGVENNGHTDVKVYEGVVELSNQYGSKNLNKNSKSSCDAGSPPQDPTPLGGDEKDTWQDEVNTKGSLKIDAGASELAPRKTLDAKVTAFDKKGSKDDKYAKKITLASDNQNIVFAAPAGENWSAKLDVDPVSGEAAFRIKALKGGFSSVNVSAASEDLGVSMVKVTMKIAPVKNLKVKVSSGDGKDKELLLKFKAK